MAVTLAALADRGCRLGLSVVTSGASGVQEGFEGADDDVSKARLREQEQRESCRRFGLDDDIWLNRIEDIIYCEYDPALTPEQVKRWGRQLREGFYRLLPDIVANIRLLEDPDFAPLHADFLSRLAMTFSHGDYARIGAIADRGGLAARLYDHALAYHPDPRAFLGRAILYQQAGAFDQAAALLEQALSHFPQNEALNICLGINFVNRNRPQEAIAVLRKYPDAPQAAAALAACYKALGNRAAADRFASRHRDLTGGGD